MMLATFTYLEGYLHGIELSMVVCINDGTFLQYARFRGRFAFYISRDGQNTAIADCTVEDVAAAFQVLPQLIEKLDLKIQRTLREAQNVLRDVKSQLRNS